MATTVLNREYGEYNEGKFAITETIEQTYDISLDNSLLKLKEINAEIEKIPTQISNLEKRKEDLIKGYND
jgi:predicted transcriptional regulator